MASLTWQLAGYRRCVYTEYRAAYLPGQPGKNIKDDRRVARYKFPPISPHSLRYKGASLLIASGEDYKTIQHRLGHSRASTTLDIYAHHLDHRDAEASSKLDSILETARKIAK